MNFMIHMLTEPE